MALRNIRQSVTIDEEAYWVNPFQVERGGILSLTTLSGIEYATYEPNPTVDTVPLGLMMHDQEEVDLWRALAPWRVRRAYPEFTPYPYLVKGTVMTNAVHPDVDPSTIMPGARAFLAESGLITSVNTFRFVGTFDSMLNADSLPGTTGPSVIRVAGNDAIVNPDPVLIPTAGWVLVRLNIGKR